MKPSPTVPPKTWAWRRHIVPAHQDLWTARLQDLSGVSWVVTERPNRARLLLEAYSRDRKALASLARQLGGAMRLVQAREWISTRTAPPTRIGPGLEIVHGPTSRPAHATHQLHIPHGVAFGSGDHGTTCMLLRALVARGELTGVRVLDLGTGSGVLALAARQRGARTIVATDFDADAIRTARENEALNFPTPLIRWQCADVKKLRGARPFGLVLANLFSGILGEAAPQITGSVAPGGELWLSGILRTQQREVIAAYCAQELKLIRAVSRGKWVMLQWRKS